MNAMKAWGSGNIAPVILNLDSMEVSGQVHATAALLPAENPPVRMNKRGEGPRAGLDFGPYQESNHSSAIFQAVSRSLFCKMYGALFLWISNICNKIIEACSTSSSNSFP